MDSSLSVGAVAVRKLPEQLLSWPRLIVKKEVIGWSSIHLTGGMAIRAYLNRYYVYIWIPTILNCSWWFLGYKRIIFKKDQCPIFRYSFKPFLPKSKTICWLSYPIDQKFKQTAPYPMEYHKCDLRRVQQNSNAESYRDQYLILMLVFELLLILIQASISLFRLRENWRIFRSKCLKVKKI